ncbi:MAG TPA: type II toxin-antitoxin system PemK/MazF family toxin [Abditibacterium sp.]|jgi:mRNA-degrading endonuclease toxin of MazEF toxin-antitoxin module
MQPGDVVYGDFPGAQGFKRRPCVVISTDFYHVERVDVLLAVITSQLRQAVSPLDYALKD